MEDLVTDAYGRGYESGFRSGQESLRPRVLELEEALRKIISCTDPASDWKMSRVINEIANAALNKEVE